MRPLLTALGAAALILGACATAPAVTPDAPYITAAIADPARPATDTARDADRRPADMPAFAGVRPGMVVADFWPGGGYFTRLLAGAVGSQGRVYSLTPQELVDNPDIGPRATAAMDKLKAGIPANAQASFVRAGQFAAPEPLDLVWTSQNYHDLHDKFVGPVDVAAFNRGVFAALKPGGAFVVLDHVAEAGSGLRDTETLHRIDPELVKREVTAAGFVFEAESPVLRNPADPRTASVFDAGIRGHTDQFVYRFRKPR